MNHAFRRGCVQLSSTALRWPALTPTTSCGRQFQRIGYSGVISRGLRTTRPLRKDLRDETARETNQRDQEAHEEEVEAGIEAAAKQQIRRPWQREGADKPPVDEEARKANKAMTKGENTHRFRYHQTIGH